LSFGIATPEQLVGKNPVNLDFVMTLFEARRISLLSIRTHTDFDQRLTFGDQIPYPLDRIKSVENPLNGGNTPKHLTELLSSPVTRRKHQSSSNRVDERDKINPLNVYEQCLDSHVTIRFSKPDSRQMVCVIIQSRNTRAYPDISPSPHRFGVQSSTFQLLPHTGRSLLMLTYAIGLAFASLASSLQSRLHRARSRCLGSDVSKHRDRREDIRVFRYLPARPPATLRA
jgi:hypothetical protein